MSAKVLPTSNIDILSTLRRFKKAGLPVSFLVPTETGIRKSIMDATSEIRDFFATHELHNFSSQAQGKGSKAKIQTVILSKGLVINTTTSLYRPNTKGGDARIWPYGLKKSASPTDLLAILANRDGLVIINCSQSNLDELLDVSGTIFKNFLAYLVIGKSRPAQELMDKMSDICQLGFVQTMRAGDTGVGYTLETLLGIAANSSKAPDFKGIEIKSKRQRPGSGTRTTLFSQIPNWALSRLKSSKQILDERGRYSIEKSRMQLNQTMRVTKPNSYDLQLNIDSSTDQLQQIYTGQNPYVTDAIWDFSLLKERLSKKHRETFWVTAETLGKNGDVNESFFYKKIKHTGNLDQNALPILLDLGVITLDYVIKELPSGAAKDQGYLFKMSPKNLDLLFDQVREYDLER